MALSVSLVGGPPWGFRVAFVDGQTVVSQVNPQSRADNEGVQSGDIITKVGGKSCEDLSLAETQRIIKRTSGILRLTLNRRGGAPAAESKKENELPTTVKEPEKQSLLDNAKEKLTHSEQSIMETKRFQRPITVGIGRSFVSSQDNLHSYSPIPTSENGLAPAHQSPASNMSQVRWTPVSFTPMSGGTSTVSRPFLDNVVTGSKPYRYWPSAISSGGIHSAPVTPLPPLSPGNTSSIGASPRKFMPSLASPIARSDTSFNDQEGSLTPIAEPAPYEIITNSTVSMDQSSKSDITTNAWSASATQYSTPAPSQPVSEPAMPHRPESSISDHPSLATASIDMDVEIRSTTAGEEIDPILDMSGYTGDEDQSMLSVSVDTSERLLSPKDDHSLWSPREDHSKSVSVGAEWTTTSRLSTIPSISENISSQIKYPSAFENNANTTNISRPTALKDGVNANNISISQPPKMDYSSGIVSQQPASSAMMGSALKSPVYNNAVPNAWGNAGTQISHEQPQPAFASSSHLITGYKPLNFIAPGASIQSSNGDLKAPFAPSPSLSSPVAATSPLPPPVPPKKTPIQSPSAPVASVTFAPKSPVSPSFAAVPPAPPPPQPGQIPKPPSAISAPSDTPWTPTSPGEQRTEVEVPETQSVANLRNAILAKLNGAAPVKQPPADEFQAKTLIEQNQIFQQPTTPNLSSAIPPVLPTITSPVSPMPGPTVSESMHSTGYHHVHAPIGDLQPIQPIQTHFGDQRPPPSQPYFGDFGHGATKPTQSSSYHHDLRSESSFKSAVEPTPLTAFSHIQPPRPTSQTSGYTPLPSPLPPSRPPPPPMQDPYTAVPPSGFGQPDMYRGGSVPMREGTPPRGSVLVHRTGSIDGNQVRTESYYAVPYKEHYGGQQRTVRQADYRHKGVGPTDGRGTPMSLRQQVPSGDYQHHWYKMMYKKLHQLEHPEDQSILKYHMRDIRNTARSPAREHYNSAHFYGRRYLEPEPQLTHPAYTVNYKFSDYMGDGNEEFDYERGWMPQPFNVRPTYGKATPVPEKTATSRLMRSKSAGRYESGSPLPSDIVRSSTPGAKYRVQPSRIENYAPGSSSLARYEQEIKQQGGEDKDAQIVNQWIEERNQLSEQTRQRSVPPRSGLFETNRYFLEDDTNQTFTSRRPISPPSQDEVRKWYRSIQSGGEVPYGGLRQTAPERQDSYLRAAVHFIWYQAAHAQTKREASTQACMSMENSMESNNLHETNGHSAANKPKRQSRPFWSAELARKQMDSTPIVTSPVISKEKASGKFAYERSKVIDFHLPSFRWSPEKTKGSYSPQTPQKQSTPKEKDFDEIDAYFALLAKSDKATSTGERKKQDRHDYIEKYLDYQAQEKSDIDQEYWRTFELLMDAIHDIEMITPETALSFASLPTGGADVQIPDIMERSTSFPEGIPGTDQNVSQPVKKSISFNTAPPYQPISPFEQPKPREFDFSGILRDFQRNGTQQKLTGRLQPGRQRLLGSLPHISECSTSVEASSSTKDDMTRSQSASELAAMHMSSSFTDLSSAPDKITPMKPVRSMIKYGSTNELSLGDRTVRNDFRFQKLKGDVSVSSNSSLSSSPNSTPDKKVTQKEEKSSSITRSSSAPPALLSIAAITRKSRQEISRDIRKIRTESARRILTQRLHGYHSYLLRDRLKSEKEKLLTELTYAPPMLATTTHFSDTKACTMRESPIGFRPSSDHYRPPPKVPLDYGLDETTRHIRRDADSIIEEERRKRAEREAEDARSRRHGYAPLPSRSPALTNDRFDSLLTDYSFTRASPVGVEMRGVGRAMYSFSAHNPRELAFRKGDLIRIRRMIDQNWYEGEFRGRVGIVPVNYVELAAVAKPEQGLEYTDVEESREGQAKANYSFDARNISELSLKKGEYITVTKKVDENWYEGRNLAGKVGIFPSNYVQIIKEATSQHKDYSRDYTVDGVGHKAPRPHGDYAQITPKTMDHSLDVKAWELRQMAAQLGGRVPTNAGTYRAVYAYRPKNSDELELQENDIVSVVEKCDDGWFIGTSLRSGQFGTFPGNYVKMS